MRAARSFTIWFATHLPDDWYYILFSIYISYVGFNLVQALTILFYSNAPARDAVVCTVAPLVPLYQVFQRIVRTIAVVEAAEADPECFGSVQGDSPVKASPGRKPRCHLPRWRDTRATT